MAIAMGGAVGAVARFYIARMLASLVPAMFPWPILFVNVVGCFMMGLLAGALVDQWELSAVWRAGLFIGILGGFTTFSSFSLDTIALLQLKSYGLAFGNMFLTMLFCLLATALGLWIGNLIVVLR